MIERLLIANRGEIAVRIARSATSLGMRTIAVYSDADRDAPHVRACDEAVRIGEAPASQSYLAIDRIVAAIRRSRADAVHPGYGFLSENAAFARACTDAGAIFVGPPADAVAAMGNKAAAKARMREAGVTCVPGIAGDPSDAQIVAGAQAIGYPVMLKAAAGGGGKGMRLVRSLEALPAAIEATRLESERAFGSRELLLEKALVSTRHIEVQIFADGYGATIHLGERDCSIQRRHQKVIEEAPSPAVDATLRERLGAAAVAAARAVGYAGAGTVEFLLDSDGAFYFLEMNTRLQVEHAVTEATHGIDLVAWQLQVAAGAHLDDLERARPAGAHAIEARLYAEDVPGGFLPAAGRVARWIAPSGDGIRVDAALRDGIEITTYYDPMLAKIVASGADREQARARLVRALEDLVVLGPTTNRRFLLRCLRDDGFVRGDVRTDFIERRPLFTQESSPDETLAALGAALLARPLDRAPGWRSSGSGSTPLRLRIGDANVRASVQTGPNSTTRVVLDGVESALGIDALGLHRVTFDRDGRTTTAEFARDGDVLYLQAADAELTIVDETFAPRAGQTMRAGGGAAVSPMPGIVANVAVAVGDLVQFGQTLVILEAMKMLHEVSAGASGRVASVFVEAGQQVAMRAPLVEIDASDATP